LLKENQWWMTEAAEVLGVELKPLEPSALFHQQHALDLWHEEKIAEAIESVKAALVINPKHLASNNILSWWLSTADDPKLRDPVKALEHAEKAMAIGPVQKNGQKDGQLLNTLGMALYRNGRFQEAVEKLTLADRTRNDKEHLDTRMFLAMAYWKLGNKDEARSWFDKACEWYQLNQARLVQLSPRYQSYYKVLKGEAAQLMGIQDPKAKGKD
jgi:tetratricopeptide (TPR) repeat protein